MSFRGKCYRGKNLGENVTKGKTLQGKMLQGKMFQGKTAFPLPQDQQAKLKNWIKSTLYELLWRFLAPKFKFGLSTSFEREVGHQIGNFFWLLYRKRSLVSPPPIWIFYYFPWKMVLLLCIDYPWLLMLRNC